MTIEKIKKIFDEKALKKRKARIMKNDLMRKAYLAGGFRERFAMEHGECSKTYAPEDGRRLFSFTYDPAKHGGYADASGATWDMTSEAWIN